MRVRCDCICYGVYIVVMEIKCFCYRVLLPGSIKNRFGALGEKGLISPEYVVLNIEHKLYFPTFVWLSMLELGT
jgi:hypothetical protein